MGRAQRLGFIRERPKPRGGIVVRRHKGSLSVRLASSPFKASSIGVPLRDPGHRICS
jgi:hypothetical protein